MYSKTMQDFEYHAPETVDQALRLLDQYGADARPMLGGTDLIPKMKAHVTAPAHVIALKQIPELHALSYSAADGLRVGAAVTLHELELYPPVREHYPALYEGIHSIASTQIRNLGTLVGNACNAVPSADSCPALLVLEAVATVVSSDGGRQVPLCEFFTGVCKTVVSPRELVTAITVPAPAPDARSIYYAHTVRRALDLAMVGAAVSLRLENGAVADIRIALGAVAATPRRARNAEAILSGAVPTAERIEAAAVAASEQDCAPITDMRATKEYRRELVKVLTRRAIRHCLGADQ